MILSKLTEEITLPFWSTLERMDTYQEYDTSTDVTFHCSRDMVTVKDERVDKEGVHTVPPMNFDPK